MISPIHYSPLPAHEKSREITPLSHANLFLTWAIDDTRSLFQNIISFFGVLTTASEAIQFANIAGIIPALLNMRYAIVNGAIAKKTRDIYNRCFEMFRGLRSVVETVAVVIFGVIINVIRSIHFNKIMTPSMVNHVANLSLVGFSLSGIAAIIRQIPASITIIRTLSFLYKKEGTIEEKIRNELKISDAEVEALVKEKVAPENFAKIKKKMGNLPFSKEFHAKMPSSVNLEQYFPEDPLGLGIFMEYLSYKLELLERGKISSLQSKTGLSKEVILAIKEEQKDKIPDEATLKKEIKKFCAKQILISFLNTSIITAVVVTYFHSFIAVSALLLVVCATFIVIDGKAYLSQLKDDGFKKGRHDNLVFAIHSAIIVAGIAGTIALCVLSGGIYPAVAMGITGAMIMTVQATVWYKRRKIIADCIQKGKDPYLRVDTHKNFTTYLQTRKEVVES